MGRMHAEEFAQEVRNGLRLEVALEWHLTGNHYPPLPVSLIPTCKRAIKKANAGEWDAKINVTIPNGRRGVRVGDFIEALHLESFLDQDEEDYDEDYC